MLTEIDVKCLWHHPENPRKNIGDITELADSIRKNGVMQNLTIIPAVGKDIGYNPGMTEEKLRDYISDNPSADYKKYYVLIGNRRVEAAKEAGVKKVPCRILGDISHEKQIGMMLAENMQRNDLTPYEQGAGFQMMLDLGETVENIAEKTGFSKNTVRSRLKIAALDEEAVEKATGEFQLRFRDFEELSKIKSLDTRNAILKAAKDSNDLIRLTDQKQREEKRFEKLEAFKALAKEAGMEYDKEAAGWILGYEQTGKYDLDTDSAPDSLKGDIYNFDTWRFSTFNKIEAAEEDAAPTQEDLDREQRRQEEREKKNTIDEIERIAKDDICSHIRNIIDGKIEVQSFSFEDNIWRYISEHGVDVSVKKMAVYIEDEDISGREDVADYIFTKKSRREQYLACILYDLKDEWHQSMIDFGCKYNDRKAQMYKDLYKLLKRTGFCWSDKRIEPAVHGDEAYYMKE